MATLWSVVLSRECACSRGDPGCQGSLLGASKSSELPPSAPAPRRPQTLQRNQNISLVGPGAEWDAAGGVSRFQCCSHCSLRAAGGAPRPQIQVGGQPQTRTQRRRTSLSQMGLENSEMESQSREPSTMTCVRRTSSSCTDRSAREAPQSLPRPGPVWFTHFATEPSSPPLHAAA